jgi:hypothetical protein
MNHEHTHLSAARFGDPIEATTFFPLRKGPFFEQEELNEAWGQPLKFDIGFITLYDKLCDEEADERWTAVNQLKNAIADNAALSLGDLAPVIAEIADGAIDSIVVNLGLIRALGLHAQPLWDEVFRSNMAKLDPVTGKPNKDESGKVIKPAGWTPPDLVSIVRAQLGAAQ